MAHDYRCRRCRYDLSVIDVTLCPECGLGNPHEPLSGPLARGRGPVRLPMWAVGVLIFGVGVVGMAQLPGAVRGRPAAIVLALLAMITIAGSILFARRRER